MNIYVLVTIYFLISHLYNGFTSPSILIILQNQLKREQNVMRVSTEDTPQKSAYISCGEGEFPIQRLVILIIIILNHTNVCVCLVCYAVSFLLIKELMSKENNILFLF